jgi:Ca-activated chloride channel family protein
MRPVAATAVVLLLLSALLCAQLKVGVVLVNVVATVVDGKGRTVPNLTIDDFIVEEDAEPQVVKLLAPTADLPISIGVILDASGSMQSKMRTAQRALDRFFSMIHRDDEIFLMTFATRASLIADFTTDRTQLTNALMTGSTSAAAPRCTIRCFRRCRR